MKRTGTMKQGKKDITSFFKVKEKDKNGTHPARYCRGALRRA